MKITEEQRKELFDYYYSLANLTKQWQFLTKQMVQAAPKRRYGAQCSYRKLRKTSIQYYLPIVDNEPIKVCQTMFISTFAVSRGTILTVCRKTNSDGNLVESDLRGKHQKF